MKRGSQKERKHYTTATTSSNLTIGFNRFIDQEHDVD
jgi:hypothetical protein